ncbi:Outer membrane receptor for ferric coprogen and ferric-rhodotorulic acid [Rubrivivax sp. A210]|uniref:putative porin n=1 Tax=Rubrivivax sp. A210 TaxID=2772301 RepID=UPI00191ABE2B|nr:putative porin [Rubrivivax sp. A210]CAD5373524.1 Outer membrane receptor for ferric coprogen and ferric-rhodotorulic acid [Rubrivivax sp. A210]
MLSKNPARRRRAALALAAALACNGAWAQSGERESLEALRQTTLALIELLVQNGTLPRDKADALLAEARKRGEAALAQAPRVGPAKAEPPVVRVPYVPQVVRDQIRDEVREEVVARARIERWGVPNATAEWTDRIAIEGDIRVRSQGDRPDGANWQPIEYLASAFNTETTRAPDFAAGTSAFVPTGSTQDARDRLRLRTRLAVNAKVNDWVTAGVRLASGSATDRVSTNQTLGQNFNRYAFLVDRAFVKLDPADWASVSAGRIANPWFATDMVWSENLAFEGVAASFKLPARADRSLLPFATLGYFPVREDGRARPSRSISGVQVGAQWEASELTRVKMGLAMYRFSGFEGRIDGDIDPVTGATGPSYGRYEYEAGLRQRGNTLFLTNNPLEWQFSDKNPKTPDKFRWGQLVRFKPLVATAAAEFSHFAPTFIGLSGEVVRNMDYSRSEVAARTGITLYDVRIFGVAARATIGAQQVRNAGDWQFSLGYRWLGSDAVPDAFVDSDLGGGGTNVHGVTVGFNYGLARDTQLGLRVLSGRSISSPTAQSWFNDRYAVDSVQVDLNVRF